MNIKNILEKLAIPRPNHSDTLDAVIAWIKQLLSSWDVSFTVQEFTLRPYEHALVGLFCILLSILFLVFISRKKPVIALLCAVLIPVIAMLEFEFCIPVVSWIISKTGQNIIIPFDVANPAREIIFMAHMDSKTDFFDHIERARVYKWIPLAVIIGLLLPVLMLLSAKIKILAHKTVNRAIQGVSILLILYWCLVGIAFGGFIFLDKESCGAVDNGGSVTTLLKLSQAIHDGRVNAGDNRVTIVLTSGEEVGLQGADAYVEKRFNDDANSDVPVYLVNLELVGQNGNMVYWEKTGTFLNWYHVNPELVKRLNRAWKTVSGKEMEPAGKITDDTQRFAAAGIPFITVGNSGIPGMGMGGFHCTDDNMERVNPENIRLMIRTLSVFIEQW